MVNSVSKWISGFEFANRGFLHVRHEKFECLNLAKRFRILYASDLHLRGGSGDPICIDILNRFNEEEPNLFLLGGDLVDNQQGLAELKKLVETVSTNCLVGAVAGNHDNYVGHSLVKKTVIEGGGNWLENEVIKINLGKKTIVVLGCVSQAVRNMDYYQVLCAHYPNDFPIAAKENINLVFAGHLHGSQCVLFERNNRLYPGAFFYRWNGLKFRTGQSTMFVSRGVSDTFPVRWNCPREVVVCDLE